MSIGVDMPPRPFSGQRRPDADGRCPGKMQVPIDGGCWVKLSVDVRDCEKGNRSLTQATFAS
jgi:serine/threonine-protein kinase